MSVVYSQVPPDALYVMPLISSEGLAANTIRAEFYAEGEDKPVKGFAAGYRRKDNDMSTSGWDNETFLGLIRDRAFFYAETWLADDDDPDEPVLNGG